MARKTNEELNILASEMNVPFFWSWSRYSCYKTDTYEYFLKYIKKAKEDRNSIYSVSGGNCHDILELFYGDKLKYKEMLSEYEDRLILMNLDELKYNRSDSEANEKIANKYEACIQHFFKHHIPLGKPYMVEEFFLIRISDEIVLQGYVDFLNITKSDDKKIIYITDFKTSTIYKGKKILSERGQLLIYCEGIRQKTGLPLEQIIGRWNFLKYVSVECIQANGKTKTRYIERNDIGTSLASSVKMWLRKSETGYSEDDIEKYLKQIIVENSLECLPNDVKNKFVFSDCYVEIPVTEEDIEELKEDIIKTVAEINDKTAEYLATKSSTGKEDDTIFWQDVTDVESFRLSNLTGYSRQLHKPYDAYLQDREMFEDRQEEKDEEFEDWLMEL